jgi:hypothetical protein
VSDTKKNEKGKAGPTDTITMHRASYRLLQVFPCSTGTSGSGDKKGGAANANTTAAGATVSLDKVYASK